MAQPQNDPNNAGWPRGHGGGTGPSAVDAGTTILVSKKVRLTDWNRRKFHIWLNGL